MTVNLFSWITVGTLHVPAALLVDPLSITMCLFVTGISALIHLYSTGYMHGEKDFRKFFLYLNLFVFSMLLLVLANNLVLTFVGWEGVGLCSYWLVSYYFERDAAASAGKKAFIYNRVGDVGMLVAMFLIFSRLHTLTYLTIFERAGTLTPTIATLVVLALLLAATGKSAQIPLFNWLPDAMEGPTPVSALIHAATMVTAGVYLLVRMSPVLALSHSGRMTIAVIGGVTAFVAATIATSQKDIKKVLAFSTISQIGYMVFAVGVGAYGAAIFLMISHAFFKALLFLGSGSVIHSLNGEQDMRKMGGLQKYLPLTFPTFLIGWLAISGIPPFAGFWSKGDVLTNVFEHNKALWVLGVLTAILTALLHESTVRPDVPRHRALPRGHRRSRPARVAVGDDDAARRPGRAHGRRRRPRPAVGASRLARRIPRADLRVRRGRRTRRHAWRSGDWRWWTSRRRSSDSWRPSRSGATSRSPRATSRRSSSTSGTGTTSTTRTIGRPLTETAQFEEDVIEPKVIDGAVTGLAVSVRRSGEGAAQGAVRLRAPLRARDRARRRGHHRLPRGEGRLVMHSSCGSPSCSSSRSSGRSARR